MYRILVFMTGIIALMTGSAAKAAEQAQDMQGKTAYDFSFQKIDGDDLPLSQYKGKAMLVVNTASRCGFTKQYGGLQDLYEKYKDRGFVLLGVPSNDFMGQEPGSNEEIKKFCETNFNIDFPMTEKVSVKGDDAHPFYQWARVQPGGDRPGWNFHKFLISTDGKLLESFGSSTKPNDKDLVSAIEAALPKQ